MKRIIGLGAITALGLTLLAIFPNKETVADVILAGTAGVSWVFVFVYMTRSHWSATAAGRAIIRLVVCIAAICTQGLATILTDYSYPGRSIIRPMLLLLVGVAILDLLWTLIRIQRRETASPDEES
ncbi:hypothetical protein [Nocardia sp. NBC_00511]|uniref:putative phage holin n=1 Tax=Nocardia sp. NBC_00511 TaxID=2903591 RepID=UPI0030DFE2AB